MPFGPYTDFEDCVSQNGDKSNPEAFCAWLHHQILGVWPTEASKSMPKDAWEVFMSHYSKALNESKGDVKVAEVEANTYAVSELEKAGWFLSRSGWVHQYEAPKMKSVLGVKVFASGKWTDSSGGEREWTDSDLDKMVDAFVAGVPPVVPVKAGHTDDTFNTNVAEALGVPIDVIRGSIGEGQGQISLGRMATLERRGSLLMASFERVPEKIADLIDSGLYSTVSVEIEDVIGDFGPVLTAVALLGAEKPAVEGATLDRAMVFGGQRQGARVFSFSLTEDIPLDDLKKEFGDVNARLSDIVKGMRGAPIFRALFKQLGSLFDQMLAKRNREHAEPPKGTPNSLKESEQMSEPKKTLREMAALLGEQMKMSPDEVLALASSLGLGDEVTLEDILGAIEALKTKAQSLTSSEQESELEKVTQTLKEATDKIAALEHNALLAGWEVRCNAFAHISGKKEEIAATLVEIEEKAGVESAEKMFASYQSANDAQKIAFSVQGTAQKGDKALSFESEVEKYQKEHPDVTRGNASKAVMRANPGLYREYKTERRRIEAVTSQ